jgi:hypothetical protein
LEALDKKNFEALKQHPGLYQTIERQPSIRAAFPDLQTTIEHFSTVWRSSRARTSQGHIEARRKVLYRERGWD